MNDVSKGALNSEEKNWAVAAHISGLVAAFIIPVIGGVLAPLVIWLMKRDQMPFVADQGREALNFQITVAIAAAVCFVLAFLVIGLPLLFLLGIGNLVFCILAAIKASEGVAYRYPITLRLVN